MLIAPRSLALRPQEVGQIVDVMLFPCDSTQAIHWQRLIAIKQVLVMISHLMPLPYSTIKVA